MGMKPRALGPWAATLRVRLAPDVGIRGPQSWHLQSAHSHEGTIWISHDERATGPMGRMAQLWLGEPVLGGDATFIANPKGGRFLGDLDVVDVGFPIERGEKRRIWLLWRAEP